MNNYAESAYGYVSNDIPGGSTAAIKALLTSYVNNTNDYALLCSGEMFSEISPAIKLLVGGSFRDFLKANYDNGCGLRAATVRVILQYLNHEVSGRTLIQRIKGDLIRTRAFMESNNRNTLATRHEPTGDIDIFEALDRVSDNDYHAIVAVLGGQFMSRFMLTFLGVYDA